MSEIIEIYPHTLKWTTYLFQILTIWATSLHFSFDTGCIFCSLKASTKMYLFCIGTNTAAFRTFRLSSQVLDKARVHRHPALDSRLTWPKWSEPNMRSPPPSVSPGINLSAGQGLNIQITASPTSLICVTDQNTIFRPTSPSSTLFVEFILNSFSIYGHKWMLSFHGSHLDSNVGSPSLHAPFSADLAPESTNTWGRGWRSSKWAVEAKLHPKIPSVTMGENTKTSRRGSAPDPKRTMSTEKRDIFIGIRSQDEFSWTSGGSPLVWWLMVQIKAGRQVTGAAIEGLHIGVASWHPPALCQSDPRIFYQVIPGSKYQRWITQHLLLSDLSPIIAFHWLCDSLTYAFKT